MKRLLTVSLLFAVGSIFADATIKMAVRHGQLLYDVENFQVKPAELVKLVFHNNDEMQHNVVICKPLTDTNKLGMAAVALGAEGLQKQFIPASDAILWHTPLVEPGDTYTLAFTAPEKPGVYPYVCTFPGHFNLMKGVMIVGDVFPLRDVTWQRYDGTWSKLPDFAKLAPRASGAIPDGRIDFTPAQPPVHNFGMVFTATFAAPAAGKYEFRLAGDDGIRLLLNDKNIVEHDGIHPMETHVNTVKLPAGDHALRLEYFQGGGGKGIALTVSGPGIPETVLSRMTPRAPKRAPTDTKTVIAVDDQIQVYRTGLNYLGKHPYAICFGFPGGINCAFDADDCALIAVWQGDFLDAGQDWTGRGGNGSKVIGDVIAKFAADARPARVTQDAPPLFNGYRVHPDKVEIFFTLGTRKVTHAIRAAENGIVVDVGKLDDLVIPQPLQGTLTTDASRFQVTK